MSPEAYTIRMISRKSAGFLLSCNRLRRPLRGLPPSGRALSALPAVALGGRGHPP